MTRSRIRIHPWPGRLLFAFTLIHDADSAYSARLRPLMEEFTDRGLRLTISVFTLWADWARNGAIWRKWTEQPGVDPFSAPVSVPLEREAEAVFYRDLARQGHEIAMHAASETADTRERVLRAIARFEEILGFPPRMYIEHSRSNNLDTQYRYGNVEASDYYVNDVLREKGFWVWLDHEFSYSDSSSLHNLLAGGGTLFDGVARSNYGLGRAFRRNGRGGLGNGDGFLQVFTKENILRLENERGAVLQYTHLDAGWLDQETRRIREEIAERLDFLSDRPAWFATASDILDRFEAINRFAVTECGDTVTIRNNGPGAVTDVSILATHEPLEFAIGGLTGSTDSCRPFPIGDLGPDEAIQIELGTPGR